MFFLRLVWDTVLESLFPLSPAEKEILGFTPEKALFVLPPASAYSPQTPEIVRERCCSIFAYQDERVTGLVWNIKYKKSSKAIGIGGFAIYQNLKKLEATKILIVPIPITKRRRRERGFNQCELLAAEIARLDADGMCRIETGLLSRTTHRDRQTLKNREERLQDARGIFEVDDSLARRIQIEHPLAPIVIIDDVITTGSTIREAILTLDKAGFKKVRGLSLAH